MSYLESSEDAPTWQNGRPKGKKRIPLTKEEKKERKAHSERQRRDAYSSAINHLATVLECPEYISGDDVIKNATFCIKKLTNTNNTESLFFLRHVHGLLNNEIKKLCLQLGITVDEIDNLDIDILEANTNEIPEDILVKANAYVNPEIIIKNVNTPDADENIEDESAQFIRTHNKTRGTKRAKLDASHNLAWFSPSSSEESAPSQSGVPSKLSRRSILIKNYSDNTGRSSRTSHEWPSNLEPFPLMPTSSTLSNEGMTSYRGLQEAVSSTRVTSSPGSPSLPSISAPAGNLAASIHHAKHEYSNVLMSHPRKCPLALQSVELALENGSPQSSTSDSLSPEVILPTVHSREDAAQETANAISPEFLNHETSYPEIVICDAYIYSCETASHDTSSYDTASDEIVIPENIMPQLLAHFPVYPREDAAQETANAISPDSLNHETPSPEIVISDAYIYSCETASHGTSSYDTASDEIVIPERIMPQLLAHFPVWPTPESMPSTSPTNPELQWSSTEIQPVPQLQLQSQSLQPCVQPTWLGQQPYYCEPQINFNNVAASSQLPFSDLEELSVPVEHPWSQLSHETNQMANDFFGQNESYFGEFFANM